MPWQPGPGWGSWNSCVSLADCSPLSGQKAKGQGSRPQICKQSVPACFNLVGKYGGVERGGGEWSLSDGSNGLHDVLMVAVACETSRNVGSRCYHGPERQDRRPDLSSLGFLTPVPPFLLHEPRPSPRLVPLEIAVARTGSIPKRLRSARIRELEVGSARPRAATNGRTRQDC